MTNSILFLKYTAFFGMFITLPLALILIIEILVIWLFGARAYYRTNQLRMLIYILPLTLGYLKWSEFLTQHFSLLLPKEDQQPILLAFSIILVFLIWFPFYWYLISQIKKRYPRDYY